jgi:hypothetical protein
VASSPKKTESAATKRRKRRQRRKQQAQQSRDIRWAATLMDNSAVDEHELELQLQLRAEQHDSKQLRSKIFAYRQALCNLRLQYGHLKHRYEQLVPPPELPTLQQQQQQQHAAAAKKKNHLSPRRGKLPVPRRRAAPNKQHQRQQQKQLKASPSSQGFRLTADDYDNGIMPSTANESKTLSHTASTPNLAVYHRSRGIGVSSASTTDLLGKQQRYAHPKSPPGMLVQPLTSMVLTTRQPHQQQPQQQQQPQMQSEVNSIFRQR